MDKDNPTQVHRALQQFSIELIPAYSLEARGRSERMFRTRDADAKRKAEPVMTELGRRFLEEYVPTHCKPSTQGEYRRWVDALHRPRDRRDADRRGRAQGHRQAAFRPARQTLPGEPDARRALQDVLARRDLGPAAGRVQSLPARQALQGEQARAVPVARRRPSGWARSSARPSARCRRRSPPSALRLCC